MMELTHMLFQHLQLTILLRSTQQVLQLFLLTRLQQFYLIRQEEVDLYRKTDFQFYEVMIIIFLFQELRMLKQEVKDWPHISK